MVAFLLLVGDSLLPSDVAFTSRIVLDGQFRFRRAAVSFLLLFVAIKGSLFDLGGDLLLNLLFICILQRLEQAVKTLFEDRCNRLDQAIALLTIVDGRDHRRNQIDLLLDLLELREFFSLDLSNGQSFLLWLLPVDLCVLAVLFTTLQHVTWLLLVCFEHLAPIRLRNTGADFRAGILDNFNRICQCHGLLLQLRQVSFLGGNILQERLYVMTNLLRLMLGFLHLFTASVLSDRSG